MAIFDEKIEIRERCKGVHCVDLGESFPTSIYLQKSASIQPRTSSSKFGGKFNSLFIRLLRCANNQPDFTLQQTVYFGWALARLHDISAVRSDTKVQPGFAKFKDLVVDQALPGVHELTTKNLAMICWAMAHLQKVKSKRDVSSLLHRVGFDAMSRGLDKFLPGELSSLGASELGEN